MRLKVIVVVAALAALPSLAQSPATAPPAGSFAPLVDRVKDSVVNVEVQGPPQQGMSQADLFEYFFKGAPPPQQQQQRPRTGIGSGILIAADGWVLTNNHVVEGARSIRIRLADGRRFEAEVVGRDPLTDVALARLKGKVQGLPFVPLGDSDALKVGDWVVAIGNPFGLASSVSAGIVSARARNIGAGPYDEFLQTDAAINPGNSGGPLFNTRGEVVGMNTAIVGGGTGIGFAVPSNLIKGLLPQLRTEGVVTRGWLGIYVQDLSPDLATALKVPVDKGALVSQVPPNTPAAKANLRADDVIVAIGGEPLESAAALTRRIALAKPGTDLKLKVYRDGRPMDVTLRVGTRPDVEGVARSQQQGQQPQKEPALKDTFGLTISDAPAQQGRPGGAVVLEVAPGSAASRAELEPGMVIVGVGNTEVKASGDLISALQQAPPGSSVVVRIRVPNTDATFLRALVVPGGTQPPES